MSKFAAFLDAETLLTDAAGDDFGAGGNGAVLEYPVDIFHPRNTEHQHTVNVVFHVLTQILGDSSYDVVVEVADNVAFNSNVTQVGQINNVRALGAFLIPLDHATMNKLGVEPTHIRLRVAATIDSNDPTPVMTAVAWITKA